MADLPNEGDIEILIKDPNSGNRAVVDADGSLQQKLHKLSLATSSDTLTSNLDSVVIPATGYSALAFTITGTYSGTITIYGSVNGSQLFAIPAMNKATGLPVYTITGTGMFFINCAGLVNVTLVMSPYVSGTATVTWNLTPGSSSLDMSAGGGGAGGDVYIKDYVNGYRASVDAQGRLLTSMRIDGSRTIELAYDNASIANYVANMWRNMLMYTVPAGYNFELIVFNSLCGSIAGSSRICHLDNFGSYNIGTNTFTDGSAITSPDFASGLEAEVTTVISATAVTLTVTYVNQDGVAGRTGTISVTASAAVGYRFPMTLQAGDYGVRDVTAVSRSASPTGVVKLYGVTSIFHERNNVADQTYVQTTARQSIVYTAGDVLGLEITGTNATNTRRMLRTLALLVPL